MTLKSRMALATARTAAATALSADTGEKRIARRKPGMIGALIDFPSAKSPAACVVRDMSATGARIQIEPKRFGVLGSTGDVPERLTLILRVDQLEIDCSVVWRNATQIGLRFHGGMRPLRKAPKSAHGPVRLAAVR